MMKMINRFIFLLFFLFCFGCSGTSFNNITGLTDIGISIALSQAIEYDYSAKSDSEKKDFIKKLEDATETIRSEILYNLYGQKDLSGINVQMFFDLLGSKISDSQKQVIQFVIDKIWSLIKVNLKTISSQDLYNFTVTVFESIADCFDIFVSNHIFEGSFKFNLEEIYGHTN